MKLRNFLIVLFAVLMVFAFASCKNEPADPKPQPKPQPQIPDYYQIVVTEGVDKDYWNRDKIKIEWEEEVNAGDTISLKYRSERDVYQWDIRDGSLKWVYETKKGSFTDPVLGEDGWYTLTYTFANDINGAAVDSNERFGVYFRGNYVSTDLFEIKDIYLNDEPLEITQDNIKSYAELAEEPVEHDWSVKNWSVLFATGTVGEVDKTPLAEKVVDGGFVTGAPVNKEGYTLSIFTDAARTIPFDPTQPITEAKIFYYSYVGIPRTVIFNTMGGSAIENEIVANGDMLVAEAEPTFEGKAFKAWYKDAELTEAWVMTDPVLGDMTLYAAYGDPATVTFQANNGEEPATKIVAIGNPVKMPETPTNGSKMFLGWYSDAECTVAYDFSAPVTADITVYAAWVNATDVTLMDGTTTIKTFKTALDVALAEDDENLAVEDDKIGYVFGGWYADAELTTEYDYTAVVTAPVTLYAKWTEAPVYKMVATHGVAEGLYDYDKFELKYTADAEKVNVGDVISFRYRSTTPFTFFSVRDSIKWVYENSTATRGMDTYETKEDGWTYVTYTFTAKSYDGKADAPANATWKFHFGSRTIVVGDVLEVQDLTLNGKPLEAKPSSSYAAPTLTTLETADEWAAHTVTFNTDGGSEIEALSIAYGGKVVEPEATPTKEGSVFFDWYADAELTTKFNFDTPIFEDTTIYVKWVAPVTLTFDAKGGSEVASIANGVGLPFTAPAEPTREGYKFIGWFEEETFENEFDFAAGIAADKTIYAKWIVPVKVTLDLNYAEAPEAQVLEVEGGVAVDDPRSPSRAGYFFAGWYKEAECTNAVDFAEGFAANATIYAKWAAPTKSYKYTITSEAKDRIQFRWKKSAASVLSSLKKGDTFTFMVKFTPSAGAAPTNFRLRNAGESDIGFKYTALPAAAGDGWITVTAKLTQDYSGDGLLLGLYCDSQASNIKAGDICEIKAVAFNGVELPIIEDNNEKGLYPGASATFEEITL